MSRLSPDAGCPDEDDVAAFLRGRLPPARARDLQAHVSCCAPCRLLLSALARTQLGGARATVDSVSPTLPLDASAGDADLPAGARIGRYVVLERRGAGGMGVVYAVHDPELNREVAVKLLHADGAGMADRLTIRDLLVREAQAMARVAHPNVVTVFEVGSVGDRVFLAMELVKGQTLDEWLRTARRDASEILTVFVAAGKGLAAAHAAGLVHRDFKPTNVLVGDDGRVRVTDFGLARAAHAVAVGPTHQTATEAGYEASVTGTGVVGTLAYMAPEQYRGRPADARADQFSFAVALYEALHGARPFEPGQLTAPDRGELGPTAPRGSDLPIGVRRVLRRALSTDPGARYPSMAELLTALAPETRPWRGRAIIAAAAVLVALAIAYVIHLQRSADQRTELVGWLRGVVPEMRTLLRSERMLPLHDIRPARAQVRDTLRTVERLLQTTAGHTERALGLFVLGEGARALGDHARALPWLEAAWEAGERGPHIDAALGDVLGAVYETQREQLAQTMQPAERKAELRAIEKRYRDPAMVHLRAALAAREASPAYLEALIAFHDHRFAEAIQRARAAFAESPRFYEAGELEARAHHAAGYELTAANKLAAASAEFATARRLFGKVLEIARSDDSTWLAYAAMIQIQIVSLAVGGERDRELEQQALAALRNVQAIDPDNWRAFLREADILLERGNLAILRYRDPSAEVDRALALTTQALAHGADRIAVDPLVCTAQWERAVDQSAHGIDPRAAFALAMTACRNAAAARPTAENLDLVGVLYSSLGDYEGNHGGDPTSLLELGERNLRAALAIDDDQGHHYNLGRLWVKTARQQVDRGLDPGRAIDQALVEFEATLKRSTSRIAAWAEIGNALVSRAQFQLQAHGNAQSTLEQARVAVERALASDPTNAPPIRYRILITELEAEALLARNADPSTAVQHIRSDVAVLLDRGPRDSFPHRLACRAELIAARWALAHHGAVDPLLRSAADEAVRATQSDALDALAWTARAEVELVRGEAARARGLAPRAVDVASGLAFIERAKAIDPRLIDTLRVRDELERQATIAR